ncbi:uncharacterized protein LOC143984209 [Lithobates pipiens]
MVGVRSAFPNTVYVKTGSEFGLCDMKCPQRSGVLQLFPPCQMNLAEVHCDSLKVGGHPEPRFQLNTSSGCWKMRDLRKEDSCEYIVWYNPHNGWNQVRHLSSTHISVLDPVLITNITSNFSRLGEEVAVSVQFSGEESAVTWEVDGEPIPERYRLIDDNRTLIIPGVQRDDAERRFRVRITNPVSEEIREYRLEIGETDSLNRRSRVSILAAVICVGVMTYLVYQCYRKKENQDHQSPKIPEHEPLGVTVNGHGQPIQNGSKATREN